MTHCMYDSNVSNVSGQFSPKLRLDMCALIVDTKTFPDKQCLLFSNDIKTIGIKNDIKFGLLMLVRVVWCDD